jgi:membrane protease subunit HflK
MFGGKGGGAAPQTPSGRQMGGGLGLLIVIVLLVWLASGFYIVDAPQRGIVLRFGKYIESTQPGPRWHLPWPIESAEVVNVSGNRSVEIGYRNNVKSKVLKESLMITDDENIIDIQFAVQYFLKDPGAYLFNNRNPDENVRQSAETAIREVVGRSKMDFVLYEGREEVAGETTRLMQDILDRYNSGIIISKLTMQNAQPPEQVQAAFDDAVKAGQDRERQKNEGQAYANDVVPKAKGAAARLMEEASGYKQSVIANAEGDASRFKQILAEYEKAPQVTRERMYIDMVQQIMTSSSKVMIDQKNGNGSLLYLPLDKLMQQTGAVAAPQAASKSAEQTPVSEYMPQRARELLIGREREAR